MQPDREDGINHQLRIATKMSDLLSLCCNSRNSVNQNFSCVITYRNREKTIFKSGKVKVCVFIYVWSVKRHWDAQKSPLWQMWKRSAWIRNAIHIHHMPKSELKQTSADLDNDKCTTVFKWVCRALAHAWLFPISAHVTSGHTGSWKSGLHPWEKSWLRRVPEFPVLLVRLAHRLRESIWTLSVFPERPQLYRPA